MGPKAVIFDMDGTLLDTETLAIETGIKTLAALGLPQKEDVLHDLVGRAGRTVDQILRRGFGDDIDISLYRRTWDAHFEEACEAGISLKPGAHDLLSHLATINIPHALGTNAGRTNAHTNLTRAGLGGYFGPHNIFGSDCVANPKPAPDVFLAAADFLKTHPQHCVVFEDSEVGTAAALAAGMTVVQVPDQRPAGTANAHHLADTLLDGARAAGLLD